MFCSSCGKKMEDNAKFCCFCGEQISIPSQAIMSDVTFEADKEKNEATRTIVANNGTGEEQKKSGHRKKYFLAFLSRTCGMFLR